MPKLIGLFTVLQFLVVAPAAAENLVRDSAALEQIEIQGVSLSMTAEQAFDALRSAGFQAGNLDTYADWDSDGIEFVSLNWGDAYTP